MSASGPPISHSTGARSAEPRRDGLAAPLTGQAFDS